MDMSDNKDDETRTASESGDAAGCSLPLYDLQISGAELTKKHGPVLVHAFEGFLDAGHVIQQFTKTMKKDYEHKLIASFDIDMMYDYRGRRPRMKLANSAISGAELPKLELYAVKDKGNKPFLLLTGQEPDFLWQRFSDAIASLAEQLGVTTVIGVHAIPTGTPHTRPAVVNGYSAKPELMEGLEKWDSEFTFSASMSAYLDLHLQKKGFDTVGLVVRVPHYLQHVDYPECARALLMAFNQVANVSIHSDELAREAAILRLAIDQQVEESEEITQVVAALERQYDTYMNAKVMQEPLIDVTNLPSGDDLASEFEKYLASLDNPDESE